MPELPGRIDGEIVYADHMNEAQIRAVQRYNTEATRDILNPAPETGQPAWIIDIAELQIWDGTTWIVAGDGVFLPLSGGTVTGVLVAADRFDTQAQVRILNETGIEYHGAPVGSSAKIGFSWGGVESLRVTVNIDGTVYYAIPRAEDVDEVQTNLDAVEIRLDSKIDAQAPQSVEVGIGGDTDFSSGLTYTPAWSITFRDDWGGHTSEGVFITTEEAGYYVATASIILDGGSDSGLRQSAIRIDGISRALQRTYGAAGETNIALVTTWSGYLAANTVVDVALYHDSAALVTFVATTESRFGLTKVGAA